MEEDIVLIKNRFTLEKDMFWRDQSVIFDSSPKLKPHNTGRYKNIITSENTR